MRRHHCQEAIAHLNIDAKQRSFLCGGDASAMSTTYGLHMIWSIRDPMLTDVMTLYVGITALVCAGLAAYLNGQGVRSRGAAARPATRQVRAQGGSTDETAQYDVVGMAPPVAPT